MCTECQTTLNALLVAFFKRSGTFHSLGISFTLPNLQPSPFFPDHWIFFFSLILSSLQTILLKLAELFFSHALGLSS